MSSPELQSLYQDIIIDAAKARHGYQPGLAGSAIGLTAGAASSSSTQTATVQTAAAHTELAAGGSATAAVATQSTVNADHCAASHQYNPTCGDELTVQVELDPAREGIVSVAWDGQGCSISQASVSLLTDLMVGKPVAEARTLIDEFRDVMRSRGKKELDIEVFEDAAALSGSSKFLARVKCAMLGWVALEDALLKLS